MHAKLLFLAAPRSASLTRLVGIYNSSFFQVKEKKLDVSHSCAVNADFALEFPSGALAAKVSVMQNERIHPKRQRSFRLLAAFMACNSRTRTLV